MEGPAKAGPFMLNRCFEQVLKSGRLAVFHKELISCKRPGRGNRTEKKGNQITYASMCFNRPLRIKIATKIKEYDQ